MSTIVVTLLPVGQGAMNLIEIYKGVPNQSPLLHLSLIDCGTDRTRPANYDTLPEPVKLSVDYVVTKMEERVRQDPHVFLDYVLFTHRDSDHWTLFDTILKKEFGTMNIGNSTGTVRTFQRDINAAVSEDFFGHYDTDHFSYTRTYSQIDGITSLNAEYQRTFRKDAIVEESLVFHNTEQNYQVSLTINMEEEKLDCEIYNQDNCPVVKAHLAPYDQEQTSTSAIYSTFMDEWPIEKEYRMEVPYIEEPLAFWNAWKLFITYLSQNELRDYDGLIHITDILNEGLKKGSFFSISQEDVLTILDNTQPVTPIISQFLWGGNPAKDGTGTKKTGVGILHEKSQFLAVNGAVEVYPFDTECSHFQLYDNICLDILARIPYQFFYAKTVDGAVGTDNAAILNNGTSAVSLLSVNGNNTLKFLFTGDATIHTFHDMRQSTKLLQAQGAVWTAPHHGSYTTSQGLFCLNEDKPEEKTPYFPFILYCSRPQAMVVESGLTNKHGHPNISFFRWVKTQFIRTGLACEPHYLYINLNDTKNASWKMGCTPYPIYSGVSAKKNPAIHPTDIDPDGLRNPVITYKIHQYGAEETDEQYVHYEKDIATGGIFITDGSGRHQPGQPAPPPQDAQLPPPPPELFLHRK